MPAVVMWAIVGIGHSRAFILDVSKRSPLFSHLPLRPLHYILLACFNSLSSTFPFTLCLSPNGFQRTDSKLRTITSLRDTCYFIHTFQSE